MVIHWGSFAVCAEVSVVANSTLKSVATNIVLLALDSAKRAITIDTEVGLWTRTISGERLIERSEAVAWVYLCGAKAAGGAVVPVRAIQALVADANDGLRNGLAWGIRL